MKKLIGKFGQRYNTAEVWDYVNPILIKGELGIESDTKLFKFGDGTTPWRELPYANNGGGVVITDPTLTRAGLPADAKATGDKFVELKEQMITESKVEEIILEYINGVFVNVEVEAL